MSLIDISQISFSFGPKTIFADISFSIQPGEIISIVGPSGCGKSTLLRLIAGLEKAASGRIVRHATASSGGSNLGFLFQDNDAYPWHDVWNNVKVGSGPKPFPENARVENILNEVGLGTEKSKFPAELSGGMRKRLGLARCLVRRPSLILLDEPFSSLDIDTRFDMYRLLQQLWTETGCAILLVTHDLHEAILLSDRILVLGSHANRRLETVIVPFQHPRDDSVEDETGYAEIRQRLTKLLRPSAVLNAATA
jgi:ABC-type nitrate/sulfonate/bicarbonate transport system ATPase subunit